MSLRPTVFIAIGLVGQDGYMSWNEIRELQDEYGFIFESHTWSHQTLVGRYIKDSPVAERTEEWFKHELEDSRIEMGRRLGKDVTALCFPAGCFSDEIVARCVMAGYKTLFASYPGRIHDNHTAVGLEGAMIIPRHLVQHSSEKEFSAVLYGALLP
jgi:peptidoglycan/xylan/chitin deacetylase (PgdA/CDA1 family)